MINWPLCFEADSWRSRIKLLTAWNSRPTIQRAVDDVSSTLNIEYSRPKACLLLTQSDRNRTPTLCTLKPELAWLPLVPQCLAQHTGCDFSAFLCVCLSRKEWEPKDNIKSKDT